MARSQDERRGGQIARSLDAVQAGRLAAKRGMSGVMSRTPVRVWRDEAQAGQGDSP